MVLGWGRGVGGIEAGLVGGTGECGGGAGARSKGGGVGRREGGKGRSARGVYGLGRGYWREEWEGLGACGGGLGLL